MNPASLLDRGEHSPASRRDEPATSPRSAARPAATNLARLWRKHHLIVWTTLGGILILTGWLIGSRHTLFGHTLFVLGYLAGGWMAAKESFDGLRQYRLDVNLLMTAAAIGAAVIGRWAEGGTLIFLFSLSNTLEHYALEKTKDAVRALMDLRPATARRVLPSGGTEQIAVEVLQVGDEILVKAGEKIPADGLIVDGRTTVDRSTFTGESIPVDCEASDSVLAGSLNLTGPITVRVSKRASDTALAAIIHRVEQAQSGRVPINSFVQWFGQRYTIGVLAGATLMALIPPVFLGADWKSTLYRSLTLLVVASPCALIISTPAAVLSAIGRAARKGVLFKGGSHLLALGTVKAIAFDKTGTLTQGRAVVTDVLPLNGVDSGAVITLAASIEAGSTHPLAQAIVEAASRRKVSLLPVSDAQVIAGHGAKGEVQWNGRTRRILVGNRRLITEHGIELSVGIDQTMGEFERDGKTTVLVGCDRILGIIALEDPPRPTATGISDELRHIGIEQVGMLTGDNDRVAQSMAKRLRIDDIQAELLPEQKADTVSQLMARHGCVAVVGDGVNDAPALVSATIGIAMGGAKNDVVLETADVVLMSDDLSRLPFAIRLSRRARRTIIQNLTFSLSVIGLLIVGTLVADIPLTLGVIGHEGSTLLVVLNSLRILWSK